jgi:hypothetical protein
MVIIASIAAASVALSAPGGKPGVLALDLAAQLKRPAFVCNYVVPTKANVKRSSEKQALIQLAQTQAGVVAGYDEEEPIRISPHRLYGAVTIPREGLPADYALHMIPHDSENVEVSGGEASLVDPSKPGQIGLWHLGRLNVGKPIIVHWQLRGWSCSFSFDRMSDRDFLKSLALATCAEVREEDEAIYFDLDIKKYREKWINYHSYYAEAHDKSDPVQAATHRMSYKALQAMDIDSLQQIMKEPDTWWVPGLEVKQGTELFDLVNHTIGLEYNPVTWQDLPKSEQARRARQARRFNGVTSESRRRVGINSDGQIEMNVRIGTGWTGFTCGLFRPGYWESRVQRLRDLRKKAREGRENGGGRAY